MPIDIQSRLTVTNEDWQQHVQSLVSDYQNSYLEDEVDLSTVPSYEPFLNFYSAGELRPLLDSAETHGFQIEWYKILSTNPSRDPIQFQTNIQQYWDWLLKDEETRMPRRHMMDDPIRDNYFWSPISDLYVGNGKGLCDPAINQVLFDQIFGQTFEAEVSFPYPLGSEQWVAPRVLDPRAMFTELMHHLRCYLFIAHTGAVPAMVLIAIEYWLSIIPHIRDSYFTESGYFGLTMNHEAYFDYELSEDEERVYHGQDEVRRFFGLIHGYQVCREEDGDEFSDNDPEIVKYIRGRFDAMDLPKEYQELLEFLHSHQDRSLLV